MSSRANLISDRLALFTLTVGSGSVKSKEDGSGSFAGGAEDGAVSFATRFRDGISGREVDDFLPTSQWVYQLCYFWHDDCEMKRNSSSDDMRWHGSKSKR